jgi:dephospho-CoA kinase
MDKKMLIIGLTGPSGAGKGAVGAVLSSLGIPCIDTDALYHQLITPPSPCLDELAAEFGKEILTPDGRLDRGALASRVFANGNSIEHEKLNSITHRYVLAAARDILKGFEADGHIAACVDAPLLIESGFDKECDKIISVIADKETRISRIVSRDGISRERALARVNAQQADSFYTDAADVVIYNDGDVSELLYSVRKALDDWRVNT